ncbi:uridine nucleosidase [Anaeramoeba flamelloides]|uniref:Uridine nucleosidase n=1 Tax=Anaeramoeba flamelloides TaxID=1746091 RepID=A0ABQ8YDZ3_9EUKA|nr:uridine nucleosidase [Anaeramoeba flamelloides]
MSKINIWFDCDPGHDDAFTILMMALHPRVNFLGISTEGGNQTVQKTTINALKMLALCNLENKIPVVQGQEHPLMIKNVICPEIHGESGIDGTALLDDLKIPLATNVSKETKEVVEPAIAFMARSIMSCEGKVTIVATARLTNVALLVTVYPKVLEKIERISIMGGSIGMGNTGPSAEFNIEGDPHAAKIVFNLGKKSNIRPTIPIVLVPIEVSHTVLVTESILDRLRESLQETTFCKVCIQLLLFFKKTYQEVFNFDSPPLHDPIAFFYLISPQSFVTKKINIEIVCDSPLTSGETVCDYFGMTNREKNATICEKIVVEEFWDEFIKQMVKVNSISPINKK